MLKLMPEANLKFLFKSDLKSGGDTRTPYTPNVEALLFYIILQDSSSKLILSLNTICKKMAELLLTPFTECSQTFLANFLNPAK